MMLIDSHAHLDMKVSNSDRDEIIKRALSAGVRYIITIGIDVESSLKGITLAEHYPSVFATVGIHPHNADNASKGDLERMHLLTTQKKVVAIGEIGLDFYHNRSSRKAQIALLKQQLEMALSLDLPVVIHDREAHGEIQKIVSSFYGLKGVIHCFSGDYHLAQAFIDMGYYISIPGTVTYKNAVQVQDVASRIPFDKLFLETDAPFLAPAPCRGRRNEPSLIVHTAQKIAMLRGVSLEEVARQTGKNVCRLFGITPFEQ